MATLTAQMMVGTPHANHDGINPTNYLFLSENSRPAWMLVPQNIFMESGNDITGKVTWIPTIENMLEDAILMIAIHVCKNPEIIELSKQFSKSMLSDRVEMYENLEKFQREQLYQKCRELKVFPKIILSVFKDSSIESQLQILNLYKMDIEVCSPIFSRLYSQWTDDISIEGVLS